MHASDEPSLIAFRREVRAFIEENVPRPVREAVAQSRALAKADFVAWQRKLVHKGWGASHWPVEWGGTGWPLLKRFAFEEELVLGDAPMPPVFNVRMIGPILIEFGTQEQKQRFLPPALAFEDWWCQGYSEPSSGSDLASLRTRATRDGDHYVVNGAKIWTSGAHWADWIFCLVRTDPTAKKQEGITFLLIDMRSPGVTVRPIEHFWGYHNFNQVLFDDVRVPVANRVGEENKGWTIAKALLEHERVASSRYTEARRRYMRLVRTAGMVSAGGAPMIGRGEVRQRVAALGIEVLALELATRRAIEMLDRDGRVGAFASVLKLKGIGIIQRIDQTLMDILGPDALTRDAAYDDPALAGVLPRYARHAAEARFWFRGPSIAGGSNEVQREILAKEALQL